MAARDNRLDAGRPTVADVARFGRPVNQQVEPPRVGARTQHLLHLDRPHLSRVGERADDRVVLVDREARHTRPATRGK